MKPWMHWAASTAFLAFVLACSGVRIGPDVAVGAPAGITITDSYEFTRWELTWLAYGGKEGMWLLPGGKLSGLSDAGGAATWRETADGLELDLADGSGMKYTMRRLDTCTGGIVGQFPEGKIKQDHALVRWDHPACK